MHLVSSTEQVVTIPDAGEVAFATGESIRTEIRCKYTPQAVERLFRDAGLELEDWITDASEWYALAVARVAR
jgi:uncharacterized SAM-dependent methyltransferase